MQQSRIEEETYNRNVFTSYQLFPKISEKYLIYFQKLNIQISECDPSIKIKLYDKLHTLDYLKVHSKICQLKLADGQKLTNDAENHKKFHISDRNDRRLFTAEIQINAAKFDIQYTLSPQAIAECQTYHLFLVD